MDTASGGHSLSRVNLSAEAHKHIRELILSGHFSPGDHLPVRALTERLGVSPTPIRMALAQLASEGILEARDRRGYFVPSLDLRDMMDIYAVREVVESVIARRTAEAMNAAELVERLENLLIYTQRAVEDDDLAAYSRLDVDFHSAIWRHSPNSRIDVIASNLLGQVRAGNRISARAPGRMSQGLSEHRQIVRAIKSKDPDAAAQAARHHVRNASFALGELLSCSE